MLNQEQEQNQIKAEHKGSLEQPIVDDEESSSSSASASPTAEHEQTTKTDNKQENDAVVIPETKEHQVGVTEDGQPIMGRDRGFDFSIASTQPPQQQQQQQQQQQNQNEEAEEPAFSLDDLPKNKYQQQQQKSVQPNNNNRQKRYVAPHADPMAGLAISPHQEEKKDSSLDIATAAVVPRLESQMQNTFTAAAAPGSTSDLISPPKVVETNKDHDDDNDNDDSEFINGNSPKDFENKNKDKPIDVTPQQQQQQNEVNNNNKMDVTPDDSPPKNMNQKRAIIDHHAKILRAFEEQNRQDNENEFDENNNNNNNNHEQHQEQNEDPQDDEWAVANLKFAAEHPGVQRQQQNNNNEGVKTPTSREQASPGPMLANTNASPQAAPFSPVEAKEEETNKNIINNNHNNQPPSLSNTIQQIEGVPFKSPDEQQNQHQHQQQPHRRSLSGQARSQVHFALDNNNSNDHQQNETANHINIHSAGLHHAYSADSFTTEIKGYHHHAHSRSGNSFPNVNNPTIETHLRSQSLLSNNNNAASASGALPGVAAASPSVTTPQVKLQNIQKILLSDAETIVGPASSASTTSNNSNSNKSFCEILCSCFASPSNAERDLPVFLMISKTPMAHNNHNHENLMKSIRIALNQLINAAPSDPLPSYDSMGFQGNDPANDLRGNGMLGLLQWYYLIKRQPELARTLWLDARSETHGFQFALASLEMTTLVLQIMKTGELNSLVDEREKAILKKLKESTTTATTATVNNNSNSDQNSSSTTAFTSPPQRAEVILDFAHDLYAGLMRHFSNLWRSAPRRSIMDFPPLRTVLKQLLHQDPSAMLFSSKPLLVGTTTHSGPSPAPQPRVAAAPPQNRRTATAENTNNINPSRVLNLNNDPVMSTVPTTTTTTTTSSSSLNKKSNKTSTTTRNAYASSSGEDGGNFSVMSTLANNAKDAEGFSSI